MLNILYKVFDAIPIMIWISVNNKLTYINKSFLSLVNTRERVCYVKDKLIIELIGERVEVEQRDNYVFKLQGKTYNHNFFSSESSLGYVKIGIFEEQALLGDFATLEQDGNLVQTVIDNLPELIFYKDREGRYRGANKPCLEFYRTRGVDSVIGMKDIELPLDRVFVNNCIQQDNQVLREGKQISVEEESLDTEGNLEVFETIKTPIRKKDNTICGVLGVVRDITVRKKEERELQVLSYRDSLTGLYNRAYFDRMIIELGRKKQFPIGIIMGDINGLKLVNDTFGHLEGDKLIKKAAEALLAVADENCYVFRWGGDEFITLIPNGTTEHCVDFIERFEQSVENINKESFQISVSLGHALFENEATSVEQALNVAENKLYQNKNVVEKSVRSSVLSTLKSKLQTKNIETEEHTQRIINYAVAIGDRMGLNKEMMDKLVLVATLHDIGKIAIPEYILLKEQGLTEEEYEIMKTHSERGYRLAIAFPEFSHVARGILTHHERWDGKGYPIGLSGEAIPLVARIVSVVDAYDVMTTNRGYNKVKTKEEALAELKLCVGMQFDPKVVELFCEIIG